MTRPNLVAIPDSSVSLLVRPVRAMPICASSVHSGNPRTGRWVGDGSCGLLCALEQRHKFRLASFVLIRTDLAEYAMVPAIGGVARRERMENQGHAAAPQRIFDNAIDAVRASIF